MGIRLTGLSTPVIGAEWEYIDKKNTVKETTPSLRIKSNHKIKVFISSQHGDNERYYWVSYDGILSEKVYRKLILNIISRGIELWCTQ